MNTDLKQNAYLCSSVANSALEHELRRELNHSRIDRGRNLTELIAAEVRRGLASLEVVREVKSVTANVERPPFPQPECSSQAHIQVAISHAADTVGAHVS